MVQPNRKHTRLAGMVDTGGFLVNLGEVWGYPATMPLCYVHHCITVGLITRLALSTCGLSNVTRVVSSIGEWLGMGIRVVVGGTYRTVIKLVYLGGEGDITPRAGA